MLKKKLDDYGKRYGNSETLYAKLCSGQTIKENFCTESRCEDLYGPQVVNMAAETANRDTQTINDTFEEISAKWIKTYSMNFKESTYIRYRALISHYLMPTFQLYRVSEITEDEVRNFCNQIETHGKNDGSGLSPKMLSDILSVLRRILRYAQLQNIHVDTMIFDIKIKLERKPLEILSWSEQQVLQKYLSDHLDSLNLGIILCLFTGIRVGELCALTWEKISLSDKTICICQTIQRIQERNPEGRKTHIIIASPKSNSANRMIPISSILFELLKKYPLRQTGYFLSGSTSKIIEPRRVQYRFHKILKECGIDRKNFHILRHTFATRCVEANIDIKTLSEILGHSSVNITMNRYVHPSLSLKRDSMERLADWLSVKQVIDS